MLEELIVGKLDPLFNQQVYLDVAPLGSPLPRVVYTIVSQSPDFTIAGPSGYKPCSVQIDVWAVTSQEARDKATLIYNAFTRSVTGFRATAADRLANDYDETLNIHACRWEYRLELI